MYVYSLNPCFNGICSLSFGHGFANNCKGIGLNPCFNGICSLSLQILRNNPENFAGLNPCFNGICSLSAFKRKDGKEQSWS